jgi:hypothetical protein
MTISNQKPPLYSKDLALITYYCTRLQEGRRARCSWRRIERAFVPHRVAVSELPDQL